MYFASLIGKRVDTESPDSVPCVLHAVPTPGHIVLCLLCPHSLLPPHHPFWSCPGPLSLQTLGIFFLVGRLKSRAVSTIQVPSTIPIVTPHLCHSAGLGGFTSHAAGSAGVHNLLSLLRLTCPRAVECFFFLFSPPVAFCLEDLVRVSRMGTLRAETLLFIFAWAAAGH